VGGQGVQAASQTGDQIWAGRMADGQRGRQCLQGSHDITAQGGLDQGGDLGHRVPLACGVEQ